MAKDLLITPEEFLKSGLHIGTKFKNEKMMRFVYSKKTDGLMLFSIEQISHRVKLAAKLLSKYNPDKIAVVGRRVYASKPIRQFSEIFGFKAYTGRFVPGTFTNTSYEHFMEPEIVFVAEPDLDKQAVKEAKEIGVPVIALATTQNNIANVDFVIPCNNRGRKSLAMVFWLLSRELLKEKGMIKNDRDFKKKVDDFEYKIKKGKKPRIIKAKRKRKKSKK